MVEKVLTIHINEKGCPSSLSFTAESEGLLRNSKVCRWHPCNQNKRPACSSKLGQTGLMFCLRKVRDYPLVNHKYPVFSGANIGIKPICLTIILCSLICIGRINVHKWCCKGTTFFLRYASFIVGFVPNMGLNVWNYTLSEKLLPKSSTNALLTLGIRRAMVLYHNAELVNPCKAGRSQSVDVSRYSKGL